MIYLDHHAATPVCVRVRRAIEDAAPYAWANPSSVHGAGRRAKKALEDARELIGAVLGAEPSDIVLTSGGTEACNLGILGFAGRHRHVITTEIEHPAVAEAVKRLAASGARVSRLSVIGGKAPSPEVLGRWIGSEPTLLALQWVNHETGTILPVEEYAEVARYCGASTFVDATQALGKLPVDVRGWAFDMMAIASTKIGGPAGAGALWVRRGLDLHPVLAGGAQERGRRPGSIDLHAHIGFAAACAVIPDRLASMERIRVLRTKIEDALVAKGAKVNGSGGPRVETVANASLPGVGGEKLVAALDLEGVCVSSGAACSSGVGRPSEVLRAMYPDEPWRAASAIRCSLGPETSESEVHRAVGILARVLVRMQQSKTPTVHHDGV